MIEIGRIKASNVRNCSVVGVRYFWEKNYYSGKFNDNFVLLYYIVNVSKFITFKKFLPICAYKNLGSNLNVIE